MFDNDDLVIKHALPLDVYFSLRRHNIIMRNIRCLDQKEGLTVRSASRPISSAKPADVGRHL